MIIKVDRKCEKLSTVLLFDFNVQFDLSRIFYYFWFIIIFYYKNSYLKLLVLFLYLTILFVRVCGWLRWKLMWFHPFVVGWWKMFFWSRFLRHFTSIFIESCVVWQVSACFYSYLVMSPLEKFNFLYLTLFLVKKH